MGARFISRGVGQYRAGETHLLLTSKFYKRNGTRRPILFCPSRGNSADQAIAVGWIDPVLNALADAGYPILSCDMGGTVAWGNDNSIASVTAARNYAVSAFGAKADKAILIGTSMGALTALNWAGANPTQVAAMALMLPVCSLADIHDNNRSGYAVEIETAYGGSGPYAAAAAAHNPASSPGSYSSIPMKLWYSSSDPVVLPGVVDSFASATGAAKQSLGAVGHNPLSTDPAQVLTFLAPYA